MRQASLLGMLSIVLTSTLAYADTSSSFSSEMLVAGKPIDPKCIYAAMGDRAGKGVNVVDICPEFSGDGFSAEKQTLVINAKGAGYDFEYENGRSGGFYYEVIGKTSEGIVLNVYYSTGGSGHFSSLSIYEREGDVLRKVRNVAGGDRATGGVGEVKVEDGHLLYSYSVTPLELYQKYIPNASYRGDLGSGFSNNGAMIHMKDNKVESVELAEDAIIPDCFKEQYLQQMETKKTVSEVEAKTLMQKLSEACPIVEKK
jgi:hypothetical protein